MDGVITIQNGPAGHVILAGASDLMLGSSLATTGSVWIAGLGAIQMADRTSITANSTALNSLGFDVGSKANPIRIKTETIHAMGANVYLRLDGDTVVDAIEAEAAAEVTVKGKLTGMAGSGADHVHIMAGSLLLSATRSIGTLKQPLLINVDTLNIKGSRMYLNSIAGMLTIRRLSGTNVSITAEGSIRGSHLSASGLVIIANGSVGSQAAPLRIKVPEGVRIRSGKGTVHYINTYSQEEEFQAWQTRPLKSSYKTVFILNLPFAAGTGSQGILIVFGLDEQGRTEVLGLWDGEDEPALRQMFQELNDRGVLVIGNAFGGGLEGFARALGETFTGTVSQDMPLLLVLPLLMSVQTEDLVDMLNDLQALFGSADNAAVLEAFAQIEAKWAERYPDIVSALREGLVYMEDDAQEWAALGNAMADIARLMAGMDPQAAQESRASLLLGLFEVMLTYMEEQEALAA